MTKNEVDILELHRKILEDFTQDNNKLDEFETKLNSLNTILENPQLLHSTRAMIESTREQFTKKIDDIKSKRTQNFYLMETVEIINNYEQILRKPKKVSFMGTIEEPDEEKIILVRQYLNIIKKYKTKGIPVVITEKLETICENCQKSVDKIDVDGFSVCTNCGKEVQLTASSSSYKDVERVNVGSKYTYDKRIHFRDCMNQYQGKQNSSISPSVYEALEEQFDLHGLLNKSRNKVEKFSQITKKHVLLFLRETGFSKHYEDAVLIHYTLTGKKPPDISNLESKILSDFDQLVETYGKLFQDNFEGKGIKINRKNFINNQYVLYQLLTRHKFPCDISEFNILKTVERKSYHDEICRKLFSHLGWNFVSVF
jgi:hypothetical protein